MMTTTLFTMDAAYFYMLIGLLVWILDSILFPHSPTKKVSEREEEEHAGENRKKTIRNVKKEELLARLRLEIPDTIRQIEVKDTIAGRALVEEKGTIDVIEWEDKVNKGEIQRTTSLNWRLKERERFQCYGCNSLVRVPHPVYLFSCVKCGETFWRNRFLERDLRGRVCVIGGVETPVGQVLAWRLLKMGARVVGVMTEEGQKTERKMLGEVKSWPLSDEQKERVEIVKMSLTKKDMNTEVKCVREWIERNTSCVDIIFWVRGTTSHWEETMGEMEESRLMDLYRANTVVPALFIQALIPWTKKSAEQPCIVMAQTRTGLMTPERDGRHPSLYMSRVGISSFMKSLARSGLRTFLGTIYSVHTVDMGWHTMEGREMPIPPLTTVDAVARLLYPVMRNQQTHPGTQRHFKEHAY
jgi:NAD(P)-dependent dehydrogenase (short-subunit alcohol dehydrogenase family)